MSESFPGKTNQNSKGVGAMKLLGLLVVVMVLSGCATLNVEQCLRGDWYGIGLADGRDGRPADDRLDRHMLACARHGVRVDVQVYLEGHAQGLLDYCRIDNAFDTGLRGRRYQHVCPPEIDPLFDRYNRAAYRVYEIRRQLDSAERWFFNSEYRILNRNLTKDNRRRLRADIRELDWRRDRLRYELFKSERYLFFLMDEARDWERASDPK
jgi:hypothetical protein